MNEEKKEEFMTTEDDATKLDAIIIFLDFVKSKIEMSVNHIDQDRPSKASFELGKIHTGINLLMDELLEEEEEDEGKPETEEKDS